MKKILALLLALCMIIALCACGSKNEAISVNKKDDKKTEVKADKSASDDAKEANTAASETADAASETSSGSEAPAAPSVPAVPTMSYAEYAAAELDSPVTVEAAVQLAAYNAEYGNVSLFLQDEDGAYYVYRMNVTLDESKTLVPGAMVRVSGYKSEWSGEVEITDATFELIDGTYTAKAKDITGILSNASLIDNINQFVTIKGACVSAAPLYSWDGSGVKGDDVYISFEVFGEEYTFLVESDEFGLGAPVYSAAESLKVGDIVDIEGYLYWYNGNQLHISSITEGKRVYSVDYIDESVYDGSYVNVCDIFNMYVPLDWEEIPADESLTSQGIYCYIHAPGDEETCMIITIVDSGLKEGETLPIEDLRDEFITEGITDAKVALINDVFNAVVGTLSDPETNAFTVNMFLQTDEACYVMTIMFHPADSEAFRPYILNMVNSISELN